VNIEDAGDRLSQQPRVRQTCQLHQPCTVAVPLGDCACNVEGEPCFANTTGPDQCQQAGRSKRCSDICAVLLAPDEAGERNWQIVSLDVRGGCAPPRRSGCYERGGGCFVEVHRCDQKVQRRLAWRLLSSELEVAYRPYAETCILCQTRLR
jgi:hypothetical protein